MNRTGLVLLPGAGLGPFIWKPLLSNLNFPTLSVTYPSDTGENNIEMDNYISHISEQIEQSNFDEFFIICHSIGGVLALPINDRFHNKVKGIIGIGSVIPKPGDNFLSCLPLPNRWFLSIIIRFLGTKPPESSITKGLCDGLSDIQIDEVIREFRTESLHLYLDACNYTNRVLNPAYVINKFDKELPLATQYKMAKRLGVNHLHELESGHLPMMSHPKKLASIIHSYINRTN